MRLQFKRLARIISFTGTLVVAASLNCHSAEFVCVNKDGVNVRTEPDTNSPVYMELFSGYPLQIIDKKDSWYKVRDFEKDSGWVYSPLTEECKTVIVNVASTANMRSGPATSNSVVAVIERGVVLELLERKGQWVNVKHVSGRQGWIYSPLVWP
jgi:SH3-like domain-containing protein